MSDTLNVLLVDDSDDDATLIVRELRRAGHRPVARRVVNESSMRAALDLARWDVVLCDSSMPGFSPVDAANLIAEKCADVPLILVTGRAQPSPATVKALEMGARQLVHKSELWRLPGVLESELVGSARPMSSGAYPTESAVDSEERTLKTHENEHWAALGRVTGSIAHELNDILATVMACSSPLMTNIEEGHPARKHLEEIERAALRASALMRDALSFGRGGSIVPEPMGASGKMPLATDGDPCGEILEAASLVGLNIEFAWQVVHGEPRAAIGDARRALERIVTAAKSMREGLLGQEAKVKPRKSKRPRSA
ncbi:MAG TPA: response regulator [Polyangiaceae bacterium]|jgi:CheY-like chemotaxis protein